MCPLTRKKCPESRKCRFWKFPGEPPLEAAKNPKKFPITGMCLFDIAIAMLWDLNFTAIGQQQAIETMRNNMAEQPITLEIKHAIDSEALKIAKGTRQAGGDGRDIVRLPSRPD